MKLKNTILASAIISLTSLSVQAATELTPEQAAALQPYDTIVVTGRFSAISDAVDAVSRRADKIGAASFYVQDTNDTGNGGNWRVVAAVYKADAPAAKAVEGRVINGLTELSKERANILQPFDTVTVQGFYRNQPDINEAIAKAAKAKDAASFFIVRQVDVNQGGNQRVTAFIYKADAKERVVQSPDAIPANSEAGKAALAAGGEAAKRVEIPGIASSETPSNDVGRFFETQSSKGGRYTVTLPDGTKIEEVNKVTAAQMIPFDSVKFTGNYGSSTEISYQVAKRAAKKGAKYYHLTRQWQENGGNITISADLYK